MLQKSNAGQRSTRPCIAVAFHLPADLLAAHRIFFNVCPFLKFAFLTVNQAILDAMEGEKVVRLVDSKACDVVAFSRRAEGPHL
ncbi:hypothetical protein O6H91_14G038700 [Diphasiastrum complanatum]|uniref:Uncharacterized protein n=1 Tax=Diphasiastrum complanatum TaxID=34168 RepID=A0ACC2BNJ8_DIPCM|nr:hypothetical protein O6H91_14G038700 [Diphasiastrum complanatum]